MHLYNKHYSKYKQMGSAYNNYIQQAATATFPKRAKKKKNKTSVQVKKQMRGACMVINNVNVIKEKNK